MLTTVLRIQSFVFAVYGLAFFLLPEFTMDTVFGWEVMTLFPRAVGATFIGIAWFEWVGAARIAEDRTLVWPFVGLPALIFAAFVWERAAGTYEGSDLFFWVSIAVTVVFTVAVGMAAVRQD